MSTSAAGSSINVETCLVANYDRGIEVDAGTIRLSNSTVTGNGQGLHQGSPGTLDSFGNNTVVGNVIATIGTITEVTGI